MALENRVNELDGKGWLRNAINFYTFDTFDINEIENKFIEFCYKNRTTGLKFLLKSKYEIQKYDFSFQTIETLENLEKAFAIINNSSYNSYHILFLKDILIDNILVSKIITDLVEQFHLEYRGKIVIHINQTESNYISFLILNRLNSVPEYTFPSLSKYKIKSKQNKSYIIKSKTKIDKIGLKHPAPYSYNDINKLMEIEKINNKTILDPFLGVGSTIIGTYKNNYNIGIELNPEYVKLIHERIDFLGLKDLTSDKYDIITGDALKEIKKIKVPIDDVITSPPYFNILKNKSKGVRHDKSQSRQGIEYYSENKKDLGNLEKYDLYLKAMTQLFEDCYNKMTYGGKFYLIISDFTINKKEKDIHSDMIMCMEKAGFTYNSTSYILQNQKAIYPFGYPYKIVLNHIFQYIIIFEKESDYDKEK